VGCGRLLGLSSTDILPAEIATRVRKRSCRQLERVPANLQPGMRIAPTSASDPQSRITRSSALFAGLILFLLAYFVVLGKHASYSVSGSDSSGYANLTRSFFNPPVRQVIPEIDTFGLHESTSWAFIPLAYTRS
jgi:hypothetical protein